ncbi:MAG: hypothetical protein WD049_02745 [Candidatus Paceibacterota bacterium]
MSKFIGKNTRVKLGTADLTSNVASITINETVDEIEDTALGQASRSRIAGLKDASVTIDFHSDFGAGSVNETVGSVFGGTAEITVLAGSALEQGTASATAPMYTVTVLCSNQDVINSQVGDISTFSVTWPAVGEVTKSTTGTF